MEFAEATGCCNGVLEVVVTIMLCIQPRFLILHGGCHSCHTTNGIEAMPSYKDAANIITESNK